MQQFKDSLLADGGGGLGGSGTKSVTKFGTNPGQHELQGFPGKVEIL